MVSTAEVATIPLLIMVDPILGIMGTTGETVVTSALVARTRAGLGS